MASSPLNGPLEVGVRVLILLNEAYPRAFDLGRLVLLDHSLLNSADLGGPESIHPAVPARTGGLGVKRSTIEQGLELLIRAGLAEMVAGPLGIQFCASDASYSFVSILSSPYARLLRTRAEWTVDRYADLSDGEFRSALHSIFGSWAEEFSEQHLSPKEDGAG